MLIRDEVLTTSGFLETIFGGRKCFHLSDKSRKTRIRFDIFRKMLILYEVITASGFLEIIFGSR